MKRLGEGGEQDRGFNTLHVSDLAKESKIGALNTLHVSDLAKERKIGASSPRIGLVVVEASLIDESAAQRS